MKHNKSEKAGEINNLFYINSIVLVLSLLHIFVFVEPAQLLTPSVSSLSFLFPAVH